MVSHSEDKHQITHVISACVVSINGNANFKVDINKDWVLDWGGKIILLDSDIDKKFNRGCCE